MAGEGGGGYIGGRGIGGKGGEGLYQLCTQNAQNYHNRQGYGKNRQVNQL